MGMVKRWNRVSTTLRNLLEFEIVPGHDGNLVEFSCSWWKSLAKATTVTAFSDKL